MLADLRRDAWDSADQTSRNLLQVLERDIRAQHRDVRSLDPRGRRQPEGAGPDRADPRLRQLILFETAPRPPATWA